MSVSIIQNIRYKKGINRLIESKNIIEVEFLSVNN